MSGDSFNNLILELYEIKAIKFGNFTLKSGIESPVYIDLRVIISYPNILLKVSDLLYECSKAACFEYASICGVPYTALPMATCMSTKYNIPMLIRRKEAKDYGTKKMVEGYYIEGDKCLIVEDVVTTGSSVQETAKLLSDHGLKCTQAVVLLNRQQGGTEALSEGGITLKSILTLTQVVEVLCQCGKIESSVVEKVKFFISNNQTKLSNTTHTENVEAKLTKVYGQHGKTESYSRRAAQCKHALASKIFHIMEEKKTNLCLSADVESSYELLELANTLGPLICVLKTHVDVLEDFTPKISAELVKLAKHHNFVLFEDRKYADIGKTVKLQYSAGAFKTSSWSDIVNAHPIPGNSILDGLKSVVKDRKDRACLLIAQMSTKDNLVTDTYTQSTIKMAEDHNDFVIGFICTSQICDNPGFIHFTPGVKLEQGGDNLGQQYLTPDEVIRNRRSDVIIVGRGIVESPNRVATATKYRNAGWMAYQQRLEQR